MAEIPGDRVLETMLDKNPRKAAYGFLIGMLTRENNRQGRNGRKRVEKPDDLDGAKIGHAIDAVEKGGRKTADDAFNTH